MVQSRDETKDCVTKRGRPEYKVYDVRECRNILSVACGTGQVSLTVVDAFTRLSSVSFANLAGGGPYITSIGSLASRKV